jgi:hypothetical protein
MVGGGELIADLNSVTVAHARRLERGASDVKQKRANKKRNLEVSRLDAEFSGAR